MEEVMELITTYGVDTVLIAVVTTVLTGIVKMPIKSLAKRSVNSHAITRFITFLPVIFGLGVTALAMWLIDGTIDFQHEAFYIQWLSAVSISLAIYAFWEKFVPSKSKILSEAEISANEELIEKIEALVKITDETEKAGTKPELSVVGSKLEAVTGQIAVAAESATDDIVGKAEGVGDAEKTTARIVLRGGNHAETAKTQ